MFVTYLFVINLFFTILTYFWARSPKNSHIFSNMPQKYIVNNKFALALFIFPVKNKITKWNLALLLIQYVTFLTVLILSVIYFINPICISFLNTFYCLIIYLIWFLCYYIPIGIINTLITNKYIK